MGFYSSRINTDRYRIYNGVSEFDFFQFIDSLDEKKKTTDSGVDIAAFCCCAVICA